MVDAMAVMRQCDAMMRLRRIKVLPIERSSESIVPANSCSLPESGTSKTYDG
jgi:hypothetical protein